MIAIVLIAFGLALASLVPALVILTQVLASILPRHLRFLQTLDQEVRGAVLIPAHNEQASIVKTIRSVRNASGPMIDILVVADNCTDDTASVARATGAAVIERYHETQRGKAFALGFGIRYLQRTQPPDVVIVIDADSAVGGRPLDRLASLTDTLGRPVQALNLIDRRRTSDGHSVMQTLGNRFHNLVRPLGNAKLGWPCLLMGSGMAFPWHLVEKVGLENTSLGEDKQLGIDMTLAGYAPVFYPYTKVASYVPDRYAAYLGQRTRWEHGHVLAAWHSIPRLLVSAWRRRTWDPFVMALDLSVPPLALQVGLWLASFASSTCAAVWFDQWWPLMLTLAVAVMQMIALLITWLGFSRRRVPNRDVFALPGYIFKKFPIYWRWLRHGPQRVWIRCERPDESIRQGD